VAIFSIRLSVKFYANVYFCLLCLKKFVALIIKLKGMLVWILLVIAVLGILIILMYNSIIYRKNQVDNAFAGIDTMLKKRYDLIPSLADTVKAYMKYEKDLIAKVTEIRTAYLSENAQNEKILLSDNLAGKMNNFFVSVENYPDLKANENYLKLQAAWNEMEDQIAASRRFYNASVNDYHNSLEMFPTNIIAGFMGLKHLNYFSIKDEEKETPSAV